MYVCMYIIIAFPARSESETETKAGASALECLFFSWQMAHFPSYSMAAFIIFL